MKVYDKEIYEKQESIKFTLLIIVVFLVGFFSGYFAKSFTSTKTIENTNNNMIIENIIFSFVVGNFCKILNR